MADLKSRWGGAGIVPADMAEASLPQRPALRHAKQPAARSAESLAHDRASPRPHSWLGICADEVNCLSHHIGAAPIDCLMSTE